MYNTTVNPIPRLPKPEDDGRHPYSRLILKGGRVVDPANGIDRTGDIIAENEHITSVTDHAEIRDGDRVIDCSGLIVTPGLIDMHVHLGDLFEVSTDPIHGAAANGVTLGLSPGAGNTYLAPSLIGAEIDRGLPMNVGVYLGAPNVLATMLSDEEIISFFCGELPFETASKKMSRNAIACQTGMLAIGIKDHMGHFIMPDEQIERVFRITEEAGLVYMSHTQDPAHAERLASLAKGRPLHLAHATAAGCGTHTDAAEGMRRVLDLVDGKNTTAEFVTSMLLPSGGNREGLIMPKKAKDLALRALAEKKVKILISDGQNDATMKGFGDTRDNIPAILYLWKEGVLSLSDAVSTMTSEPAKLIAERTKNPGFMKLTGNLGAGALANITVMNENSARAIYTIVNGRVTAFESRAVRSGDGAGKLVSRFGFTSNTGVGDLAMFAK